MRRCCQWLQKDGILRGKRVRKHTQVDCWTLGKLAQTRIRQGFLPTHLWTLPTLRRDEAWLWPTILPASACTHKHQGGKIASSCRHCGLATTLVPSHQCRKQLAAPHAQAATAPPRHSMTAGHHPHIIDHDQESKKRYFLALQPRTMVQTQLLVAPARTACETARRDHLKRPAAMWAEATRAALGYRVVEGMALFHQKDLACCLMTM
mmetsp:Transcript_28545/g.62977  ORF Transcript_28545/g.62977 Transcript_28545/m.62977 type:complete len:207 (-) Transcript_28545:187-807(-)